MKLSYTLEISVYQLVTCKKCKMAEKARALIYRRADGERGKHLCTSCTLLMMGAMSQRDLCNTFVPNQIVLVMTMGYCGVSLFVSYEISR